jgi:hypothetical protein
VYFLGNLQEYSERIKNVHTQTKELREVLKSEFFGIGDIIDNVTQLMEPWLAIPESQTKPTIINLWGMTGTGKTSLVRRIAEVLGEQLVQIDLGEYVQDANFSQVFAMHYSELVNKPCIIMLDEIQNCRTVHSSSSDPVEIDRAGLRGLWSLLSDGKLYWENEGGDNHLLIKILNSIVVYKIENKIPLTYSEYAFLSSSDCFIIKNQTSDHLSTQEKTFLNDTRYGSYTFGHRDIAQSIAEEYKNSDSVKVPEHRISMWEINENLNFRILANNNIKEIFFLSEDKINNQYSLSDVYQLLEDDYLEGLYYLLELILSIDFQKELNYSQALIFVAGNMDEVYTLSSSTDPDMTPDDLYKRTQKITVPDIKEALLQRFRPEQAARLGNNHILYPSFTKEVFEKIINNRLNEISSFYNDKFKVELIFDESVVDIVFKEGVIPTQGARPVLSTISSLIEAFIPKALYNYMKIENQKPELCVYAEKKKDKGIIEFYCSDKEVYSSSVNLNIESLRTPKYEEKSIYVAVHEAGHVVCSMLNSGIMPVKVTAFSSSSTHDGVMDSGFIDKVMSKRDLENKITSFLGGWAAEKLIFGEDLMCGGARSDIVNVTYIASQLVRELGLLGTPVVKAKEFSRQEMVVSESEEDVEEIKNIVEQCQDNALSVIKENEEILLDISNLLLEKPYITSEDLECVLDKHDKKMPQFESVKDKFEQKLKKYNLSQ